MAFSHRDRRAHRTLWRVLAGVGLGTVALSAVTMFGPDVALDLGAIAGLAVLGWVGLMAGEEAVHEYGHDLQAVAGGDASTGFTRAEVRSEVGLDRSVGFPTARSPHARSPARSPDRARPPSWAR